MKKIFESASEIKSCLPIDTSFTLVGGCFDLIHVGHLHLLEYASRLEELLIVAVLSDENVRNYKKSGRPIINEQQRATMLASIRCVDFVYISNVNPNGHETLQLLKPSSIVFGEENSADKLKRWTANAAICSPNTKVHLLARYGNEEMPSTTSIINKIRNVNT